MRRKSYMGRIMAGIVLAVLAVAGLLYFGWAFFQVEEIEVLGNGKFTLIYIQGLANIAPETHMLKLDEDGVKENIESAEPYLEVVSISKKLPRTVVIEVVERQPRALISAADSYLLADENANVLEILSEPPDKAYPVVSGFSISAATLGRQITTEDTFKITVYGELVTAMNNRKMDESIAQIDLSDINSIKMTAKNGLAIKFGQADHIADKMKSIDNMLPRLEKDNRTTGVLDVSSGIQPVYKRDDSETQAQATLPPTESQEPADDGQDGAEPTPDPEGEG